MGFGHRFGGLADNRTGDATILLMNAPNTFSALPPMDAPPLDQGREMPAVPYPGFPLSIP